MCVPSGLPGLLFLCGTMLAALTSPLCSSAASPLEANQATVDPQPTPYQDDATLYDIQFIGTKTGWAVGDHGVIWNTVDAGRTWELVPSPVGCPLRSICFLTDRIGWIVGGGTTPYTRVGYGVVLFTSDGGETWTRLANTTLPTLQYVEFFSMEQGVVVGETSPGRPSGVLTTTDGGRSWEPVPGEPQAGWRTADFLAPQSGITAGLRGRVSLVGGQRMLQPRIGEFGLKGFHGSQLNRDETGWLVGDGALVLRTDNAGVVWQAPPQPLPRGLEDMVDFRTVASQGHHVWIAGEPGNVVWHTPDGGQTWVKQFTGQTLPINALHFASERLGWAAGALGTLQRTEDGGTSWSIVRGKGRRVALASVHARASGVSFPLIARQAGDLGYRCLVMLPARHDVGPDSHASSNEDQQLAEAVTIVGGAGAAIEWRFPIALPGLDNNAERLWDEWQRTTEGRLREVLLGKLVCRLRTWRPSVVVIEGVSPADATSQLLNEALEEAVEQAADPTRFVEHRHLAGLDPWKVEKVYLKLPPGSTGQAHVDPHQYLPRLGTTVAEAAAWASSRVIPQTTATAAREAYQLKTQDSQKTLSAVGSGDFFSGISLPPGSPARRALRLYDDKLAEQHRALARKQRNFRAYAERFLDEPQHASQVIAQLRPTLAGLSRRQASHQLAALAGEYRRRSDWELAEAALIELIERYPQEPAAFDAMRWLFQFWSGAEPSWQRARKVTVNQRRFVLNTEQLVERVRRAVDYVSSDPSTRDAEALDLGPDPAQFVSTPGQLSISRNEEYRGGVLRHWQDQALRMASLIRKRSPRLYQSPEVQFPLAALLRDRGVVLPVAGSQIVPTSSGEPGSVAVGNTSLLGQPDGLSSVLSVKCKRTSTPPNLDGMLSDECWQAAEEIPLKAARDDQLINGEYPFALLSYDAEYLYFAASVPRHADLPTDLPTTGGRDFDADLSKFDRLSLFLDIDRDFATYYAFHVDQRGWTAESCWEDKTWNPQWYVAPSSDETRWRIEIAIPLRELVSGPPRKQSMWALGIVRTMPALGLQSWMHPASTEPRAESFGRLRFD